MKYIAIVFSVGITFAVALSPTPASATFVRTFVSGTGSDSNSCTRTQPCLTFAFAITQTAAGGEIDVLDPGGYGPFTITKAISIVNDGVGTVGIRALASGNAITINAGATDKISLRGLTLEGAGLSATLGIAFNSGGSLSVESCIIHGFNFGGISFSPNSSSNLSVSNTFISDTSSNQAIFVGATGTGVTVTAAIEHVKMQNNSSSLIAEGSSGSTGSIKVTIADSVVNNSSTGTGIGAVGLAGAPSVNLMVVRSVVTNNAVGIFTNSPGATIRFTQTTLTGNAQSWSAFAGGIVRSYGDNNIDGNGDGDPAPITIAKK